MPKNAKTYECIKCNFICSKESNYNKHLLTAKHKNRTNIEQKNAKQCQTKFTCDCGKEYTARNSLWYHKQRCTYVNSEAKVEEDNEEHDISCKVEKEETTEDNSMSKSEMTIVIQTLMDKTNQLMDTIAEKDKNHSIMMEKAIDNMGTKTINNINNNVNYNINLFLNDQCKDAMSLTDFIDNMKCKLEDLEDVGRLGYVDGISKLFIENLSGMEINKRPIHCTDLKRKSLYIKNNDEWTKDNNNVEMRKAINKVANKNMNNLNKWRDANPEHHQNGSGAKQQQYLKMSNEIQTFATDDDGKKGDKIIKNIIDVVSIDRGMLKSGELEN